MFQLRWSVVGILFFVFWACEQAAAQRVVYHPRLPDIGAATFDRNGNPVVLLNSNICRRRPDLCEFVRAHEFAHHRLGHLRRDMSVRQAEVEADRWATMRVSPQAIRAARQFFGSGYGGTIQNGTSQQRLATVNQAVARRVRPTRVYRTTGTKRRPVKVVRTVSGRRIVYVR